MSRREATKTSLEANFKEQNFVYQCIDFTIYYLPLFLPYLRYILFIFVYAHLILLPYAFRLVNLHDKFNWLHVVISMHYVLDLCTLYKIWPVAFSKALHPKSS